MLGPRTTNLGCVCFGWKWFQEIIFTLFHVFGWNGKYNFPEIAFLLTAIYSFDPEMNLRFHFPFNSLPEKERERERERARAREEKIQSEIASSSSSPTARLRSRRRSRSGAIAISDRDRPVIAIAIQIAIARRRSRSGAIAISDRDRSVIAIAIRAPSIAISDRDRAVDRDPRSRSPCDRDRDPDRDRAVDRDRSVITIAIQIAPAPSIAILCCDRWWFFFLDCGFVFSDLCFPSSFPNIRKYFPENFLKCNQTHGSIFLFRKLTFPENIYFLENVLQQPNTALLLKLHHTS